MTSKLILPERVRERISQERALNLAASAYKGGSRTRDATYGWRTQTLDADSAIIPELSTLRDRTQDFARNNPLASGAVHTKVTNVIGTGLKYFSEIDREFLGLSDEAADEWEASAEREFRFWAESQDCDIERTLNFAEQQDLVFRAALESGDHLVLMTSAKRAGSPYSLALQHIDAARVCNEGHAPDSAQLIGGVQKSKAGAPEFYHVLNQHPGSRCRHRKAGKREEWEKLPAFSRSTGRRHTLHLYRKLRPGQTRGVPDLAAVIEPLKQLDRYTDAEIDAAVKTAIWSILVETELGDGLEGINTSDEAWQDARGTFYKDNPVNVKESTANAVALFPGDKFSAFDPQRPNTSYDPFVNSVFTQIGVGLELPRDVLMKSFQSSYSAARAALLQAGLFFAGRRKWAADKLCRPVVEEFLAEAVALGRLNAPGFFVDPMIRAAYCGSEWVGDAPGNIDESKAVEAARERIALRVSTRKRETAALTGMDYYKVERQLRKEERISGINLTPDAMTAATAEELDDEDNKAMARGTHG